eukprot:GFUD01016126.1.p1 GENE.GFUD01016126.1~~GFUD01016126.1.p1  ORF type:complete len:794 (+),score=185.50 GFUD01016126.1:3-2384(+)
MVQSCCSLLAILILLGTGSVEAKKRKVNQAKSSNDFAGVKEKLGLFIWRIEDFTPVPWDSNKYGSFYTGDSYLVLNTKKVDQKLIRDLHFWLGNQTSQDEAGSAAILTVMLDHVLGGGAVQHREVQFRETELFKSYFKQGIKYMSGGVKSGFNFIKDINLQKRLFRVKGKRNVQASQVPLDISSLNRFDSFILDCGKGKGVMVFRPAGTNGFEKIKATAVANDIKNEDHAGKGRVEIFDEAENDDMTRFFEELGSGSMSKVSNVEINDKSNDYKPKLFQISGSQYSIMKGPLNQNQFSSNSTYLLVSGPTGMYLWMGRFTTKSLRKSSQDVASKYKSENKLIKTTPVQQVLEGLETATFKQFFPIWKELIDTKGWKSVLKKSVSKLTFSGPDNINAIADWNVRDLHQKKQNQLDKTAGSPLGFLPDDGKGVKIVWRVENFDLVEISDFSSFPTKKLTNSAEKPKKSIPLRVVKSRNMQSFPQAFFYTGDSYVILYKYGAGESIVYFWQGDKSSTDERGASALHAFRIDNEMGMGKSKQVRVEQGREPTHFLRMFGGTLVTLQGGKASGFRNRQDKDNFDEDGTMLLKVMQVGSAGKEFRVEQVAETASSLDSDDSFLLISPRNTWSWRGKLSTGKEANEAERVGKLISTHNLSVLTEGRESQTFWSALGGKKPYAASSITKKQLNARLYTIITLASGSIKATEIFNFKQADLNDRKVMMLDMESVLYLWIGSRAKRNDQVRAEALAQLYLDTDPSQRNSKNTKIIKCKRDAEPQAFKTQFPRWQEGIWGHNFG